MVDMKKDILTEMLVGKEGAIKVVGKIVACNQKDRTLIAGLVFPKINAPIPKKREDEILVDSLEYEMWEGEIIFIPRAKYRGRVKNTEQFTGLRIDQVLTSSWGNPNYWLEKIF